jgi:hypothetical protein
MSKAIVTLTKNLTAVPPAGSNPYANTLITLTDAANGVQTATVDGTETPPWTAEFDDIDATAGGIGTVVAQDQDAGGVAIGASVSQTFTEIGGGTTGATFPATTAITVAVS